jgi:8-oxo-dGTP diphosphatase
MIKYVAGFLFSNCRKYVVLILKAKPAWQAGRLNAVGGKIEPGETPPEAMEREFREETSVIIPAASWNEFAYLKGHQWECNFYYAFGDVFSCKTQHLPDDKHIEFVKIININNAKLLTEKEAISNVPWLLGLALNSGNGIQFPVNVNYD